MVTRGRSPYDDVVTAESLRDSIARNTEDLRLVEHSMAKRMLALLDAEADEWEGVAGEGSFAEADIDALPIHGTPLAGPLPACSFEPNPAGAPWFEVRAAGDRVALLYAVPEPYPFGREDVGAEWGAIGASAASARRMMVAWCLLSDLDAGERQVRSVTRDVATAQAAR